MIADGKKADDDGTIPLGNFATIKRHYLQRCYGQSMDSIPIKLILNQHGILPELLQIAGGNFQRSLDGK